MSEPEPCTEISDACPVERSLYGYKPNRGVNGALAVGFAILIIAQIGSLCCFRVRTWSYTLTLAIGTFLEVLGYVGRLIMSENPFSTLGVSAQLIALIVAPSFVSAAMSVTFKHIIVYCGAQYSWMRPRFIPWAMIGTDFLGIIIQFLGSAVLAIEVTKDDPDSDRVDLGNNIIIFGVVFQAVIMAVGGAYMVWFWQRRRRDQRRPSGRKDQGSDGAELLPKGNYELDRRTNGALTSKFKIFCWSIVFAFAAVLIRCIYRCIEMISGWGSEIMQDEASFLVLDGLMILLAITALTVFQPGFWFAPMMRRNKQRREWESLHASAPAQEPAMPSNSWPMTPQHPGQPYQQVSSPQPYQPYGA